ncbi:MAG: alginate lyase family protein [Anaerolineales bacterium]
MKRPSRFLIGLKVLRHLGFNQVRLYSLYRFGLYTGHYRRQLSQALLRLDSFDPEKALILHACLPPLPSRDTFIDLLGEQVQQVYGQAEEILRGEIRLFGGQPVRLELTYPAPLKYWTEYESGSNRNDHQDIKFIWEPARFGWACRLTMAYYLSNDERYAEAFWSFTERFLTSNPPYFGPHWSSAQEVAIRLIALAFAFQIFSQSVQSNADRLKTLAKAIAVHAERIPPTLGYARSQNNNHLITEALGLYTASALLPGHPLSPTWHRLGWDWLQYAFQSQIASDGTYIQHSTNYHRLMLQAAMWCFSVHAGSFSQEPIPPDLIECLTKSTCWLSKLVDPETGHVPNLGHNDGAYLLPLTVHPHNDYRPVIYAASRTFMNNKLLPEGSWQDMGLWLCPSSGQPDKEVGLKVWREASDQVSPTTQAPYIIQNPINPSWATLHVATFHSRPAHADQLHLDLWWHGLNLAQDPGTYLYNSPPPWDNSLTSAFVHNTVVIDNQEFMLRAGRFLYLDWAQATVIPFQSASEDNEFSLTAQHNGYRKIGVTHTRKVSISSDGHWQICDYIDGQPGRIHTARLHWLLPDWEYQIRVKPNDSNPSMVELRLQSPYGWVGLIISSSVSRGDTLSPQSPGFQLARAGKLVYGNGTVSPITGWISPTYGEKKPALACIFEVSQTLPLELKSEWILPYET